MRRFCLTSAVALFVASALLPAGAADQTSGTAPRLSAVEIVNKNVEARGGLTAWRSVHTLEMKGKMDAGGNNRATLQVPGVAGSRKDAALPPQRPAQQVQLPFLMDLERGRKQRLEIQFNGQTAVQVYDGAQGWKLRPYLNRREVEKYTAEELKSAAQQADLDGFLIDYSAKGEKIELEGVEKVDGRNAYNLKITFKDGSSKHVWVDAESFLETKMEGTPRRLDGKYHSVATYLRDYRSVSGLMMPYLFDTTVEGVRDHEKIEVETIVSNPKLDASRFAMPR